MKEGYVTSSNNLPYLENFPVRDEITRRLGTFVILENDAKVIELAKERIFDQRKSVSQIAYDLGFKYPQHFMRLFKQRVGQSPNEYRRAVDADVPL